MNRGSFAPGEWYHCYNRGVDKRVVFADQSDYRRFEELLYLSNTAAAIHRSDIMHVDTKDVLRIPRGPRLVSLGAYCLMPNHFHLLIATDLDDGITRFMRKLMTSYTMYFNKKHERTGNLFMRPFRSRQVSDDRYFQHVIRYIHCNPAELYEPGWKQGQVRDADALADALLAYPHSSLSSFHGDSERQEIIDGAVFDAYHLVDPKELIKDAAEYYRDISEEHHGKHKKR